MRRETENRGTSVGAGKVGCKAHEVAFQRQSTARLQPLGKLQSLMFCVVNLKTQKIYTAGLTTSWCTEVDRIWSMKASEFLSPRIACTAIKDKNARRCNTFCTLQSL
uniref:Uncharacterized protein n=1 Tax=Mus musculus TaxID=10090 RepID=Q8C3H1_MOUSE|nr:unnamed protein product [Mus musculus]